MSSQWEGTDGGLVQVAWMLPSAPELTAAIEAAGFELVSGDQAAVVISDDRASTGSGSPFGPRRIVVIDADASADPVLESGPFRVLRRPLDPDLLLAQVRRAAAAWHRARRLLLQSAIVGRVTDLVVATDGDGRVIFVNEGLVRTLGVSATELVGQDIDVLFPGANGAPEDESVGYTLEQVEGARWVQGVWQLVRDLEDQPLARLFVGRDVTRERSLSQDLVRSGALAELGMMAAEVAHEVNNPATYLMTNLSILRDDLQGDTLDTVQAAELVDECLDGVTRITDIVRRIRSLATSHADEALDSSVDLSWVVRDACRIAGLRVKYKAELHIHDAVMPAVRGSAKRIGQVVLNLVVNAADALGGQIDPLPRIDLTLGQDETHAWIDVRDNGPGVPDAMSGRMFEAFVTSKAGEGGTGLGLSVSATIAEEHGGTLELMAHGDRGAWFRLQLPLPRE